MTSNLPVVLVDDDEQILLGYKYILNSGGIENVHTIQDSGTVMSYLKEHEALVIIIDLIMPEVSGIELLMDMKNEFPDTPVIVMTATNDLDIAVNCIKEGAFDYLVKPVDKNRFISSITKAVELRQLREELQNLREHFFLDRLENESVFSDIITQNRKMHAVFHYVEAIAKTQRPILIYGETGVGKELLARAIHTLSEAEGDFVAVNVAGLDDTMFSDTLFGHKKGAFTGANMDRKGLIERADRGTLLLDEIGDLNEASQLKLLRLLEQETYYALGSDIPEKSGSHIIASTHRDLSSLTEDGKFRKDLYYRLYAHSVVIPPLRERSDDIPLLLNHFIEASARSLGKSVPAYPSELHSLLATYMFPGNVRELQAMVHDAVAQHKSGVMSLNVFRKFIQKGGDKVQVRVEMGKTNNYPDPIHIPGAFPTLKDAEEYLVDEALKRSNQNQGIAASLLGISRQALNKRLNRAKKA